MNDERFHHFIADIESDHSLSQVELYPTSAWYGHAPFLKYLIKEFKPKSFVELGTHFGFSYFAACEELSKSNIECETFAIDSWEGDKHAGIFDESVWDYVQEMNLKYSKFSTLKKMYFDDALNDFDDCSIDLLHIDGLHTYRAVKHDFETWVPKVSKSGIILFHDINVRREDFGVYKFWAEIKSKFHTIEFNHTFGLGVVFMNTESLPLNLKTIVSLDSNEFRFFDGAIGTHVSNLLNNFVINSNGKSIAQNHLEQILNSKTWRYSKILRAIRKKL